MKCKDGGFHNLTLQPLLQWGIRGFLICPIAHQARKFSCLALEIMTYRIYRLSTCICLQNIIQSMRCIDYIIIHTYIHISITVSYELCTVQRFRFRLTSSVKKRKKECYVMTYHTTLQAPRRLVRQQLVWTWGQEQLASSWRRAPPFWRWRDSMEMEPTSMHRWSSGGCPASPTRPMRPKEKPWLLLGMPTEISQEKKKKKKERGERREERSQLNLEWKLKAGDAPTKKLAFVDADAPTRTLFLALWLACEIWFSFAIGCTRSGCRLLCWRGILPFRFFFHLDNMCYPHLSNILSLIINSFLFFFFFFFLNFLLPLQLWTFRFSFKWNCHGLCFLLIKTNFVRKPIANMIFQLCENVYLSS